MLPSIRRNWIAFTTLFVGAAIVSTAADQVCGQTGWGSVPQQNYMAPGSSWDGNWLGSTGVRKTWQLGITGENTDTGVVVRQVAPNSPAARSGIFPGDMIVCVDGDQVGRVGSQIFDLQEELNHHADSSGRVQMLILFNRSRQLQSRMVQLQDQASGLAGSIVIQGGRAPADAVVTVRLENVTRPFYTVRNGEYSFRLPSFGGGNIPFQLNYDPAYVFNRDVYRVRAFVTSGGRTIFDTVQPQFVLTQGNPSSAQLVLRPTALQYQQASSGPMVSVAYSNPADVYQEDIVSTYQRYLGRSPTSLEMAAWHHTYELNDRTQRLSLELMATDEYFNRAGGNNLLWMQRAFTDVIGHAPSPTEVDLWMRRFGELRYSRMELLGQLNMQARR